jgi:hypothetical protein
VPSSLRGCLAFGRSTKDFLITTNWFNARLTGRWRTWARALDRVQAAGTPTSVDEAPLRAQFFTAEEMEQHGRHLAATHELTRRSHHDRLLRRLGDNEMVLADTCALLAHSADQRHRITPAGEWLLDNFYLIEEEVRTAKRHLPPGYSRELPRIAGADNAGLPRVYDLALHAVAHGDSRLGRGSLTRFIASYQTVKTLRLGELWAVPIMLRLALIENLRRIASRVTASLAERDLAGLWADRMIDVAERDPKGLILVVADMARSEPPMTAPFVAELSRRLHGRTTALALPLTWVEQHLGESHQTIEQLVKFEAQAQAAAQVSVSNSIGSLRLLASMDWREFVETLSKVEQVLRDDPADVYARMEFATRDSYRHAVERIARRCVADEAEVASAAVQLARESAVALPAAPHRSHVGYWLVDAGQAHLERRVGMRAPLGRRVRVIVARSPLAWFASAILTTTLLLVLVLLAIAADGMYRPLAALPLGAWVIVAGAVAASLVSASHLAVAIVNWFAPLVVRPRALPRMDFSFGIPSVSRTLVVVPTAGWAEPSANAAKTARGLQRPLLCGSAPRRTSRAVVGMSLSRRRSPSVPVRYVITLDTDTDLPWGAGWRLFGAAGAPVEPPGAGCGRPERWCAGTPSCSRASGSPVRSAAPQPLLAALAATWGSTPTHASSPTCTRTCSPRDLVHRQGHLRRRRVPQCSDGRFPDNACSATTCSSRVTPARRSAATWRCSRTRPRVTCPT